MFAGLVVSDAARCIIIVFVSEIIQRIRAESFDQFGSQQCQRFWNHLEPGLEWGQQNLSEVWPCVYIRPIGCLKLSW